MAKKKAKRSTAVDRYASQVGAETTLKFGPEESSLRAALRDAEDAYGGDVAAAHGTRRAIEQAAKTAKPQFKKSTDTALGTVREVQTKLAADLAALPQGGSMAGASTRDSAGTERRLAEALAANETETEARRRDAVSGEAFATSNARSRLGDAKQKIATRQSDLAGEKGAFAQARAGELVEGSRDRSVTRRGQDKTAEQRALDRESRETEGSANRASREKISADKKKTSGRAKPADTEKAKTSIQRALEQALRVKGEVSGKDKAEGITSRDRAEAAKILVSGRQGQTIKNDKDGNPLANPIKVPGVNKTEQLYASVALDLAYDGHLSTANMRRLQKLGLSVRDLGLNTKGRSGTRAATPREGAANPVKPKPLPSGTSALGRGPGILPQVTR